MTRRASRGPRGVTDRTGRGNVYDRRRRRAFLIERFGVPRKLDGALTRVKCYHCGKLCKADGHGWEVDRYPVCGHLGGRYTRDNIVPSCCACNKRCADKAACERRVAALQRAEQARLLQETGAPF